MLIVETSVRSVLAEIEQLSHAEGEYSKTYCEGAVAALEWVLNGGNGPSKTALLLFKNGQAVDGKGSQ